MAKVNVRKETGKLVIDFTYRGVRCREQTALGDSAANRKRAEAVVKKLHEAMAAGTFVYSEFFPGSALAPRFLGQATGSPIDALPRASTEVAAAAAAAAAAPATPTFRDFTSTWLSERQIEWRRSHIKVLKSTLDGHLMPVFGDRSVGTITKAEILAFRAKLAELPGRVGDKLSNKRINGILAPLTQILNEASERYAFASPVVKLKRLKTRKSDVNPFSLDEVQKILATVRMDWRDYFTVRFLTGMRTGEAHGLKWKYVDFEHRLILIRETFVLGEDDETKTEGSMRDIQMSQPVFEAVKRQHEATGKLSAYVFCNREGQPIDNKNFSDRVWYPLLRHLGLVKRRPYQMRHTAATLWLASGEAPEWIANQLGHSNSQMLFTVYSRWVPNMTRRDGSAIDRLLATRFSTGSTSPADAPATPPKASPPTQPPPVNTFTLA
jgi:integrase